MRILDFQGTPSIIGRAFGESCRQEIGALYEARVSNAITQAAAYGGRDVSERDVLWVAKRSLPLVQAYHPAGYEELCGISDGAGLPLEKVWAMNALTDVRDVLSFGDLESEGCTSFIVQGQRSFIGQTWDLATDNMPHVVIVRRSVEGGPSTACLTLVGCLSLIGLNAAGLAIGTTNIRTYDSRIGVGYLDLIHKFLAQSALETAARAILDAPRAGAHYYFAMDEGRRAVALECTAERAVRTDVNDGFLVHANHVMEPSLKEIEAPTPMASSHHRHARMEALVSGADRPLTEQHLMRFLADHDGGETSICRHDYNGISSNGAVIMEPAARKMWALHGQACQGEWIEVDLPS